MALHSICITARNVLTTGIVALLFLNTSVVEASTDAPSKSAANAVSSPIANNSSLHKVPGENPLWSELSVAQQHALAPLASEWDKLEAFRKNKWLAIGNKFASMKPDEQQRVHERMREWVKLSPEQRQIARESFARAKKLDREQKSEQWQQYQQLPDEQKKKLAAQAAAKKNVATLPPASQAKNNTVPPIKSAPKPILEQSVTPQAASQSAISASSSQPAK